MVDLLGRAPDDEQLEVGVWVAAAEISLQKRLSAGLWLSRSRRLQKPWAVSRGQEESGGTGGACGEATYLGQ